MRIKPFNSKSEPRIIGIGGNSVVFRISEVLAFKVKAHIPHFKQGGYRLRKDNEAKEKLESELEMSIRVYEKGISSPEPLGLRRVKILGNYFPGYVMEYIPGIRVMDIEDDSQYSLAELLIEEEVDKARKLGFIPYDTGDPNTLFVPERNRIYLIDFSEWEYRPKRRTKK